MSAHILVAQLTLSYRCRTGCTTSGSDNVVSLTGSTGLERRCSDNCQTVFGGLAQTWRLFPYIDGSDLQPDDIIGTPGLLVSGQ